LIVFGELLKWTLVTMSFIQNINKTLIDNSWMYFANYYIYPLYFYSVVFMRAVNVWSEWQWQAGMAEVYPVVRLFPRRKNLSTSSSEEDKGNRVLNCMKRWIRYEMDLMSELLGRNVARPLRAWFWKQRGTTFVTIIFVLTHCMLQQIEQLFRNPLAYPVPPKHQRLMHNIATPIYPLQYTSHLMLLYVLLIPWMIYKLRACRDAFGIRNRLLACTVLHLLALAIPIASPHYRPWKKVAKYFPPEWIPFTLWGIAFLLDVVSPVITSLIQPITYDEEQGEESMECKKHHTRRTFELCFIVQVAETECGAPCCSPTSTLNGKKLTHPWMHDAPSLILVLDNVKMAEQFEAFTIRMRGRQELLFYRAVQLLHLEGNKRHTTNDSNRRLIERIESILDQFIAIDAPCRVKLDPCIRARIWEGIKQSGASVDVFDEAQGEVVKRLERREYTLFMKGIGKHVVNGLINV
jgi:hypothetical protein